MSSSTGDAVATVLSKVFIIFGGVLPYIPQYRDIKRSGDASGFSTFVCLLLILANTLRITYWVGHHFDEALLAQSVLMILTMFVMLDLCVRMERLRKQALNLPIVEKYFTDFKMEEFWQWTNLSSYIQVTVLTSVLSLLTVYLFIHYVLVVEAIGYAALLTESCLAVPQFLKNQRSRSVQGMNVTMIIMWAAGDAFKAVFYVWKKQPLPFIICASIQLFMDFLIMLQIAFFH